MKILAVGDLHNDNILLRTIVEESKRGYDLLIGLGDFYEESYYRKFVEKLKILHLNVTGNWDMGYSDPKDAKEKNLYNYMKVAYEEYKIILIGSVFPDDIVKDVLTWVGDHDRNKVIVASHYPPYMLTDLTLSGNHAGLAVFRELLIKLKPILWLCGHIHEAYGMQRLIRTTVLNASALTSRKGYSIELGDGGIKEIKEVKF